MIIATYCLFFFSALLLVRMLKLAYLQQQQCGSKRSGPPQQSPKQPFKVDANALLTVDVSRKAVSCLFAPELA